MPNPLSNMLLRSTIETVIWLVDDGKHIVSVRNYTSGVICKAYIDAVPVGKVSTMNKANRKKLKLPDGRQCAITIHNNNGTYSYELAIDGATIPRDTTDLWEPETERLQDLDQRVSVPEVREGSAETDGADFGGVSLYLVKLEARDGDPFTSRDVWRRFNDFDELYTLAHSSYFNHHLASR